MAQPEQLIQPRVTVEVKLPDGLGQDLKAASMWFSVPLACGLILAAFVKRLWGKP